MTIIKSYDNGNMGVRIKHIADGLPSPLNISNKKSPISSHLQMLVRAKIIQLSHRVVYQLVQLCSVVSKVLKTYIRRSKMIEVRYIPSSL